MTIDFTQVISAAQSQAQAIAAYQAEVTAAINAHVEDVSRQRNYNSAAHIASYTTSTVPLWASEAAAFVAWRDAVWLAALAALGIAQATGVLPERAALLASMPFIVWPE